MPQDIHYTALEKLHIPKPVDRLDFISQAVKGKNVLDLGAYDETAFDKKAEKYWLHGRIAASAKYVLGVDNSTKLPDDGLTTSENSKIIRGNIFNLHNEIDLEGIEIIVAGELIEHLPDTSAFLSYLQSVNALKSKTLLLSTPNAACLSNFFLGMFGRENNDLNHLQIYSYKTLHTLFLRAGFQEWQFQPYHEIYPEMIRKTSGIMKGTTQLFQKCIHIGEYFCPLLSGGWIVQVTI